MARELTEEERLDVAEMIARARAAMAEIEDWSQENLDRLSQAIAWYAGNEKTFTRLAEQGVDESGIGDRTGRPAKRFKIQMVLRDVLRTPSTGIVEVDEARG
jgi:sulfoacetaldehyde dehydrogenase